MQFVNSSKEFIEEGTLTRGILYPMDFKRVERSPLVFRNSLYLFVMDSYSCMGVGGMGV